MNAQMRKIEFKPYVKYVVLKVGPFESEIIDEKNFGTEDAFEISGFKRLYCRRDDCVIVKIDM